MRGEGLKTSSSPLMAAQPSKPGALVCVCVCLRSYMQTGCTSLKLIMRHFWTLISDTLKATPSVGVDITREER